MKHDKKNITAMVTGMAIGAALVSEAAAGIVAEPTWQKIYVDGQQVSMTAYNIAGHNYVRLRDIIDLLPSGFRYDSRGGFAHQGCTDSHSGHHGCDCFLIMLHADAPFRFVTQSNITTRGQKLYDYVKEVCDKI